MGVMVYSRLGDLLRARHLTVDDLQRQIAARFDLAVDARTLDRLARDERVRRPDVEIAAAAAAVLDARLDDIFAVDALPMGEDGSIWTDRVVEEEDVLPPEQSRRLSELFDLRGRRPLTDEERAELDALVGAWGRAVSEREFGEVARRRGIPVEQVRAESLAEIERVLAWWKDVEADPARRAEVVRDAQERRRTRGADIGNGASPASADRRARAI
jgi:hypothetical protein